MPRIHHFWKQTVANTRRTYNSWRDMQRRCYKTTDPQYKDYGGRGITVCERWKGNYDDFYEDMGECPPGMSIERVDNNQGYDPFNCIWATKQVQMRNRRSNIRYDGKNIETDTAREAGINLTTLRSRLSTGMTLHEALTRPVRAMRKRKQKGI